MSAPTVPDTNGEKLQKLKPVPLKPDTARDLKEATALTGFTNDMAIRTGLRLLIKQLNGKQAPSAEERMAAIVDGKPLSG